MQDPFTRRSTCLQGRELPSGAGQSALLDGYRRRLEALDRLGAAAFRCGGRGDSESYLFLPEDVVSLLRLAGNEWAEFHEAIQELRLLVPLLSLDLFGFPNDSDEPLEERNSRLRHVGSGVEAWAFADAQDSVYKFYRPRVESAQIGATFHFQIGENALVQAESQPGSYRDLFEKLRVINALGGMSTELLGVTREGILVAKQTGGFALSADADVSDIEPQRLIPIPPRFLRADRKHPRLAFINGEPWLIADTHNRNVVRDRDGFLRIIDLVAAPLPDALLKRTPQFLDWIECVRFNPAASLLGEARDEEL